MRLISILTAALVTVFLYFLVIERDRLMEFASGLTPDDAAAPADAAPAETAETPAATPAEGGDRPVGVMAMRSQAQMIDSAVRLRGETAALRQVDVRAETSGQVISEPLRKGSFIEAGQLLCKIDIGTREASLAEARARLAEARARVPEAQARIPEAEARVEEARARLEEARINANAATQLSKDGFASETRVASTQASVRGAQAAVSSASAGLEAATAGVESARAGIESAGAAVAAAEKEIARLTMTAPFAGLLESDTAELGSLLQPGGLCATIIQLDPIKVVGFVPETAVARIETGALAGARLTGGREVQGRVSFLSRSADPATRTFRVEIAVDNADLSIRDGQTAEILIAAQGARAHLIPQSALTLNDEGALGVRLVDADSRALFAPVEVVRDTVGGVWVTGLPEEAAVITLGQEYVTDGVAVTPEFQEAKG